MPPSLKSSSKESNLIFMSLSLESEIPSITGKYWEEYTPK